MVYYKKQENEVEGAIYIENIGWFAHEEMSVIPEAEKNCLDYFVIYELKDYFISEIYETESRTPTSFDCLIDGDKHIGFYCYGTDYIFDDSTHHYDKNLRLNKFERDGRAVMAHVYYYPSLKSLTDYMQNNKVITRSCFYGNRLIEELRIPEGVEKIESLAFSGCKNLKRIVIPRSVKKIEEQAFAFCSGLDEVYILGGTEIEPLAFERCDHLKVVFGPTAKINYYSFYIYERHGRIGGSAYWANYGFDHYAVDQVYFMGTQKEYEEYLSQNEQLAKYLKDAKVSFYSETPRAAFWHLVDDVPVEW